MKKNEKRPAKEKLKKNVCEKKLVEEKNKTKENSPKNAD
jgi:hypothetical protein